MEQSDIKEVINILKQAYKFEDWAMVYEAIDYLTDFSEDLSAGDDELEE